MKWERRPLLPPEVELAVVKVASSCRKVVVGLFRFAEELPNFSTLRCRGGSRPRSCWRMVLLGHHSVLDSVDVFVNKVADWSWSQIDVFFKVGEEKASVGEVFRFRGEDRWGKVSS